MDAAEELRWPFSDGSFTDLLNARSLHGSPDIKKKAQFHSSLVQKLALEKELEGHVGCVNAIAWNSNGSLLVSGSDDTRINIWSYNNRELLHDIDTGHSANIFCTKFVPETCDEVVASGAGDAEVRVFNMSRLSGRRPREISMEPAAVYQCHSRRVKKLAVEIGNPNVVWSASEDGTLRQHDFRECSSCPRAGSSRQECRNVLVSIQCFSFSIGLASVLLDLRCGAKKSLADAPKQPLALKSCDISSVRPHQIIVGGSPNGKEVLLSYSGEHVYLFDVDPDNRSSVRYTADDVLERLYAPLFHKELAKQQKEKKRFSVNTTSRNLCRVDMCKKLMQVAAKYLETETNLMHGIEACSEVLESVGLDIDDGIKHDCLCTRAGLYLKRKWKNDVYMAIRDCNRARNIDPTSFQAHLYMAEALLQLGRLKEASDYTEAANSVLPPHSQLRKQVENMRQHIMSAENQKNKTDQDGNVKADTRHGKLRSLSDILFRDDVSGSSSQEGREDSDYDDEMELDYETSVSGDESRENDQNVIRGSLSFRFHQRDDQTNEHTSDNGLIEPIRDDCSALQSEAAIDMKQRYVAHCNVGTDIKQASFLGEQDRFYVVLECGSDICFGLWAHLDAGVHMVTR
ncbi:hypothetical protein PR202_ga26802 [Eleusine coracana subsp. coracana]|uniref:WD and tetratricopeptide repeats protein 1 n=1 Tax=Eleusine coracana subsp. coracana TaxID=191504 RepID=A0AAV5DF51_ELECO|nr:hypothetical protein PR202_ga26802 [Eleusine coracana subsp. coracana]